MIFINPNYKINLLRENTYCKLPNEKMIPSRVNHISVKKYSSCLKVHDNSSFSKNISNVKVLNVSNQKTPHFSLPTLNFKFSKQYENIRKDSSIISINTPKRKEININRKLFQITEEKNNKYPKKSIFSPQFNSTKKFSEDKTKRIFHQIPSFFR